MIRLILLSDFTESFSYNLLKGVLMYANSHEPWVVCRMPLSYKQTYGIKGSAEVGKKRGMQMLLSADSTTTTM